MSTQNQIETALACWSNGHKEMFKNIIQQENEKNNIFNYRGRGDILIYFLPALLIEEFWNDLQDIGFPLENIVCSNTEVVGWLKWPKAVEYMKNKDPSFLKWPKAVEYMKNKDPSLIENFIENGLGEEQLFPYNFIKDSENLEIILAYFNTELRSLLECAIEDYLNTTQSRWEAVLNDLSWGKHTNKKNNI